MQTTESQEAAEKERRVAEYQLKTFGRRYVGANLAQIRPGQTTSKLAKFLEKPTNFLLYCGGPGIGKTHFCAALTEWMMRTFYHYRYWTEADLHKRLRSDMGQYGWEYSENLRELTQQHLIILDDVGSTGTREWREEVLFTFLDSRYNSMLPTIITSNFTKADFKKVYQPRIIDRLFDKDNIIIEDLEAKSYRTEGIQ